MNSWTDLHMTILALLSWGHFETINFIVVRQEVQTATLSSSHFTTTQVINQGIHSKTLFWFAGKHIIFVGIFMWWEKLIIMP